MFAISLNEIGGVATLGLLLAVLFGVLIWLGIGLFEARSLLRRELSAYFLSPIAYVVMVVFLAVMGFLFMDTLGLLTAKGPRGAEWPIREMLDNRIFWLVFLLIPTLLTMRLFAEERSTGTLEMLLTAPLRDWQVVLSKYVACLAFYAFLWLPTLLYLPIMLDMSKPQFHAVWTLWSLLFVGGLGAVLVGIVTCWLPLDGPGRLLTVFVVVLGLGAAILGGIGHYRFDQTHVIEVTTGIDPMPVLSSYLGFALAGGMFLGLGMFISSLVRSQMVAALITMLFSLVFIAAGFLRPDVDSGSFWNRLLYFFSVPLHFHQDFSRGVIDSRHVILYLSVAVGCVFLTVRSLEMRRWQ